MLGGCPERLFARRTHHAAGVGGGDAPLLLLALTQRFFEINFLFVVLAIHYSLFLLWLEMFRGPTIEERVRRSWLYAAMASPAEQAGVGIHLQFCRRKKLVPRLVTCLSLCRALGFRHPRADYLGAAFPNAVLKSSLLLVSAVRHAAEKIFDGESVCC